MSCLIIYGPYPMRSQIHPRHPELWRIRIPVDQLAWGGAAGPRPGSYRGTWHPGGMERHTAAPHLCCVHVDRISSQYNMVVQQRRRWGHLGSSIWSNSTVEQEGLWMHCCHTMKRCSAALLYTSTFKWYSKVTIQWKKCAFISPKFNIYSGLTFKTISSVPFWSPQNNSCHVLFPDSSPQE